MSFLSSTSQTKSRVNNINNSLNLADGANAFAPRLQTGRGNVAAASTQSGIAVQGRGNSVEVTTTDYGALATAGQILDKTLQSQANLALEAVGFARSLGETKVSDGANITSKTTQIALYTIAALVAIFFIFRR